MSETAPAKPSALRELPSVDQLLKTELGEHLRHVSGTDRLTNIARQVIDELRSEIRTQAAANNINRDALLNEALRRMESLVTKEENAGLRRVINATGVILHTNLGRAPLSADARAAIAREATGYCTLEYDSNKGSRGRRGARVEQLLAELTGAEAALVVNNCAAALLVLTVLAQDGETVVSRGELVEIGGDFRVPDVMANSGTRMVDVGTTNRTHLDDYRNAITERTRLLMRVHPSNYRVVGFTTSPTLAELATLAHDNNLALYTDAGSGVLQDLSDVGLKDEPIIRDCIAAGADVVSFSGDKLLGGPQAGLLVGKREIIDRLRKHSLYRALRVDKLTLAALQETLNAHGRGTALSEIPTLQMLATSEAELRQRAEALVAKVREARNTSDLSLSLVAGESANGGGSGPDTHPPTVLIGLTHLRLTADDIEQRLRSFQPPVISRVAEGKVLLDLRTVAPSDETDLVLALDTLAQ
jgi:L-seryl-tRNA(Ser) seleniumtransferase